MHPILKLIYLLPLTTRRNILKSWLNQLGLARSDREWLTRRVIQKEGTK
jgi:hypothetical protein